MRWGDDNPHNDGLTPATSPSALLSSHRDPSSPGPDGTRLSNSNTLNYDLPACVSPLEPQGSQRVRNVDYSTREADLFYGSRGTDSDEHLFENQDVPRTKKPLGMVLGETFRRWFVKEQPKGFEVVRSRVPPPELLQAPKPAAAISFSIPLVSVSKV